MNQSAESPDQAGTAYNANRARKLMEARSGIGWVIVLIAAITVVPSIYDGIRHGVWISSATFSGAVLVAGNLLVYWQLTRRLSKLKELEGALDHRANPMDAVVTPAAVQPGHRP
jgi:predicted Co/Zn/Cd cation transporter (cation efflux family)